MKKFLSFFNIGNVLSLFDGMSCGQIALNRVGIKYDNYFASEIDSHAIKVTQANYPNTIQLGDVTKIDHRSLPKIGLLIGGSPCQGFSLAGRGMNFDDPRSKLFFEYVRLLRECNPEYFLLENVVMKKEYQNTISEYLGVEPIKINSALVSAQNRKRLYWTNIANIVNPVDKSILLKDVIEGITYKEDITERMLSKKRGTLAFEKAWSSVRNINQKSKCLTAGGQCIANSGATNLKINDKYYKLTPTECERLQTVPDNYTSSVSNTERYRMLGNGRTVDVICHILQQYKTNKILLDLKTKNIIK